MTWELVFLLSVFVIAGTVIYLDHRHMDKSLFSRRIDNALERIQKLEHGQSGAEYALQAEAERTSALEKALAEVKKFQSDAALAGAFPQFRPRGQRTNP